MMTKAKKSLLCWAALAPIIIVILFPYATMLSTALKQKDEIFTFHQTWWPREFYLGNFSELLFERDFGQAIFNSLYISFGATLLSAAVAIPAAYAFSRYRFFADRYLFFGFLMFRMMAPAILLVPFVQIFSELQLIDTYVAVALAHCFFNVPIAIWILEGFVSAVPRQMDELAMLDGYGLPRFFLRILLPQIAPGIAVTAFFCFLFSWVEMLLANALTVVEAKPISAIMTRAGGVLSADIALLAAASVLSLVPGVILLFFVRNHLARGFSMGRVV